MNDSAGAFVPAGVGGLDGYAEAFTALRKISGVVPSIMCMFGFNAGGGSYLPRQGSFVIQPADTFFGLTGPGVVKSVLGEDVTPDDLGGPKVHGASGVADLTVADEVGALRTAQRLLSYLPDSQPRRAALRADHATRSTGRRPRSTRCCARPSTRRPASTRRSTSSIIIQQICDHGDYFELQPDRARNAITAFGRLGGNVVGFVANNSAGRQRPDRHRRRLQDRPLRPLLQHLQHPDDLHGGHHRLPARARAGEPRHRAGRPRHARLHHRHAHAAHPADHPQRLRRRLRRVQQLRHRRRHGARAAHHARRRHGHRRQGVRLQEPRSAQVARRGRRKQRKAGDAARPKVADWLQGARRPSSTSATSAS